MFFTVRNLPCRLLAFVSLSVQIPINRYKFRVLFSDVGNIIQCSNFIQCGNVMNCLLLLLEVNNKKNPLINCLLCGREVLIWFFNMFFLIWNGLKPNPIHNLCLAVQTRRAASLPRIWISIFFFLSFFFLNLPTNRNLLPFPTNRDLSCLLCKSVLSVLSVCYSLNSRPIGNASTVQRFNIRLLSCPLCK